MLIEILEKTFSGDLSVRASLISYSLKDAEKTKNSNSTDAGQGIVSLFSS